MMTQKKDIEDDTDAEDEEFNGKKHFDDFGYDLAYHKLFSFFWARYSDMNESDLEYLITMHSNHIQMINDNNLTLPDDKKKKYEEDKNYITKTIENVISCLSKEHIARYYANNDQFSSIEIINLFHKKLSDDSYIKDIQDLIVLKNEASRVNLENYSALENYDNWKKLKHLSWNGRFKQIDSVTDDRFRHNNEPIGSDKLPLELLKQFKWFESGEYYLEIDQIHTE